MKINCNSPTCAGSYLGHDAACKGQGASTYGPERTQGLCKSTQTRVPRCCRHEYPDVTHTHTPPHTPHTHGNSLGTPGCAQRSALCEVTHPPAERDRLCLAPLPRGPLKQRPRDLRPLPFKGGVCALRPISSAGARPAARGRWRTRRAAWGSGPRVPRWAGGPRVQPAALRGARVVPRVRL